MSDHARGDCKKVNLSSEEEELLPEASRNFPHIPPTVILMSQLNLCSKTFGAPGTFGEAPAVPTPPATDDADRQFWAEDEMSSSESRFRLVCKQKRRHSLAYRNRVATRRRSNSLLRQSSSSNSDSTVHLRILSPHGRNARRRRKNNDTHSSFATKKAKVNNNSVIETTTPIRQPASRIPNASAVGNSIQFETNHPNSGRQINDPSISIARRRYRGCRSQKRNSLCIHDTRLSTNNEPENVDECQNQNPRPPSTSKRK